MLLEIYSGELTIAETQPLCLRLRVALEDIDCAIELNFRLPPLYPTSENIVVSTFVPPPFASASGVDLNELQTCVDKWCFVVRYCS